MTIRTKATVGGTEVIDYRNLRVSRNLALNNASSYFSMTLDSPFGRHANDFNIGDEVIVKANQNATPTTTIFTGVLEKKRFRGEGIAQELVLSGRDYSVRLMDKTVEPVVFTNTEISTIVTTILASNNIQDITTTNVDVTSTTLKRIAFNHPSVFEAIKDLAELAGFLFYVDANKDLHFEEIDSTDSGVTLNNDNVLDTLFDKTREGMANRIWVYGDRYLSGFKEELSADGGSVFTLLSKPHNAFVEYLGNPLLGGVFELVQVPVSGTDYLVNFHDKQLIFVSGTDVGYNSIPASGGSILIDYDRELPIAKVGQDDTSILLYGTKEDVIRDKTIRDPNTAVAILQKKLEETSPLNKIDVRLKGWFTFNVGETVSFVMSDFGINESAMTILGIDYVFDKNTIHSENEVVRVKLSRKILDITDQIKDINTRLEQLESEDAQNTDIITRLIQDTGSFAIAGSRWDVYTRTLGSSFILGHPGTSGAINTMNNLVAMAYNYWHVFKQSGLSSVTTGSFLMPGTDPDGIAIDNNGNLITADYGTDHIYLHSGISTVLTGSFASPGTGPGGLVIDPADNLISLDKSSDHIYTHSGISATLTGSFASPGAWTGDIAMSGNDLISSDTTADHIYHHSGISATLLGSFSLNENAYAITIDSNGNLLNGDIGTDHIYAYNGLSNNVTGSFATPNSYNFGNLDILKVRSKGIHAGGILGSVLASGINFLGDSRGSLTLQQSGT